MIEKNGMEWFGKKVEKNEKLEWVEWCKQTWGHFLL